MAARLSYASATPRARWTPNPATTRKTAAGTKDIRPRRNVRAASGNGCAAAPAASSASARCRPATVSRCTSPATVNPAAVRYARADGRAKAATPSSTASATTVTASPPIASRGCRHTQYSDSTRTTATASPGQSLPHGSADVQAGTGAAATSHATETANARKANSGWAQRAGTAPSQRRTSAVRHAGVPGGMCSAGNGTGCLDTRALWPDLGVCPCSPQTTVKYGCPCRAHTHRAPFSCRSCPRDLPP